MSLAREKVIGYHACEATGGWCYIWKNAPFLSLDNEKQWLSQGYYFWTDSDLYAHEWGKSSVKGDYAVSECEIELKKNEFLDLVGNVGDQQYFAAIIKKYQKKISKSGNVTDLSVRAVIAHYRDLQKDRPGVFNFSAIKASDLKSASNIPFLEKGSELLSLVTRQQLCVFENAREKIKNRALVYPEDYKQNVENVLKLTGD